MNGKTLKVMEYDLKFGSIDRFVNIFGFFKYKGNGNLYVLYADVDTKYELIYCGSGHKKNGNLLSMSCKETEIEIIKEYIYKIVNGEMLDSFEIYNLDDISAIEIISSSRLEVKLDVIRKLEELTLPKREEVLIEKQTKKQNNNKGFKKIVGILLLLIVILGGGFFYLTTTVKTNKILKIIYCTKSSQHDELNAFLEEKNTYRFIGNDQLKEVENISIYKFDSQIDYENFINKGDVYNYMPEHSNKYTPNAEEFSIEYVALTQVDSSYQAPDKYEEVISYYTNNGYSCSEQIEE